MDPKIVHDLTFAEVMMGDFPPPTDLVAGLLVAGGGALWSARFGVGKTWLALELARAVATGTPFLGRFPTRQGAVLYVDQEGTVGGIKDRLAKLENGRPLGDDLPIRCVWPTGVYLTDVSGFLLLDKLMARERPALVILDSWVRFYLGNENDPVAVARFNDTLRELRLVHGSATLPLDHWRKPPPNGQTDDPADRTRGTGEKLAGVDNALTIERVKDEEGVWLAHPVKTRWTAEPTAFRIGFASDPAAGAVTLTWRGAATQEEVERQVGKPVLVAQAIVNLKAQFGEDAATTTTIQGYLEWSETMTRKVLAGMQRSGQVRSHPGRGSGKGGPKPECFDLADEPP